MRLRSRDRSLFCLQYNRFSVQLTSNQKHWVAPTSPEAVDTKADPCVADVQFCSVSSADTQQRRQTSVPLWICPLNAKSIKRLDNRHWMSEEAIGTLKCSSSPTAHMFLGQCGEGGIHQPTDNNGVDDNSEAFAILKNSPGSTPDRHSPQTKVASAGWERAVITN